MALTLLEAAATAGKVIPNVVPEPSLDWRAWERILPGSSAFLQEDLRKQRELDGLAGGRSGLEPDEVQTRLAGLHSKGGEDPCGLRRFAVHATPATPDQVGKLRLQVEENKDALLKQSLQRQAKLQALAEQLRAVGADAAAEDLRKLRAACLGAVAAATAELARVTNLDRERPVTFEELLEEEEHQDLRVQAGKAPDQALREIHVRKSLLRERACLEGARSMVDAVVSVDAIVDIHRRALDERKFAAECEEAQKKAAATRAAAQEAVTNLDAVLAEMRDQLDACLKQKKQVGSSLEKCRGELKKCIELLKTTAMAYIDCWSEVEGTASCLEVLQERIADAETTREEAGAALVAAEAACDLCCETAKASAKTVSSTIQAASAEALATARPLLREAAVNSRSSLAWLRDLDDDKARQIAALEQKAQRTAEELEALRQQAQDSGDLSEVSGQIGHLVKESRRIAKQLDDARAQKLELDDAFQAARERCDELNALPDFGALLEEGVLTQGAEEAKRAFRPEITLWKAKTATTERPETPAASTDLARLGKAQLRAMLKELLAEEEEVERTHKELDKLRRSPQA